MRDTQIPCPEALFAIVEVMRANRSDPVARGEDMRQQYPGAMSFVDLTVRHEDVEGDRRIEQCKRG